MPLHNQDSSNTKPGTALRTAKVPLFSVPGFTRFILAVISAYIALTSLFVHWATASELRFFNLYYLVMTGLCAALMAYSLREVEFRRQIHLVGRSWFRAVVVLIVGAAIWVIYRYPQLFSFSIWLDEITQFQGSLSSSHRVADPALFAAFQQQPPTDYYLSAFARTILGRTELAVLIHAIGFGILSFLAFLIWLIQIRFPLVLIPLPILLFASHHTLLRFSSEARPISLAVFFSLTTLIFVYENVQRRKVRVGVLLASATLLLYSVGLQPIFFLTVLSAGLLPLLVQRFEKAEAVKFLLAQSIAPLVLFSPTLWEIYKESKRENQFLAGSYIELWQNALRALRWESFADYAVTTRFVHWVFFIPFLSLLIVPVAKRLLRWEFPAHTVYWAVAGALFSTLFPIGFEIFWGIMNWNRNIYYFSLWAVGLFALASLCAANFLNPILEKKNRAWPSAAALLLCVCGIYALNKAYVPAHIAAIQDDRSFRPDWHVILEKAREAERPVLIMEVPYGELTWPPLHSLAGKFYERPPDIRFVRLNDQADKNFGFPTFRIPDTLDAGNKHSDILYVMMLVDFKGKPAANERKQKIISAIRANVDEITSLGGSMYLFRANDQASPLAKTTLLFRAIAEADPGSDRNFFLADALAKAAIREAKCSSALRWLSVMESVSAKSESTAYKNINEYLAQMKAKIERVPCKDGKTRPR